MASETSAASSAPASDEALRAAHERLLADSRIQFALPELRVDPPGPPPDWLRALGRWLSAVFEALAPMFSAIFWGGVILLGALLLYMIVRSVMGANWPDVFRRRRPAAAVEPEYRPDASTAKVLLEDADRLAAEGRFAEAAHLLLFRSLDDIRAHRPRLIQPAITSRELAVNEQLPPTARTAFSAIAGIVERSFFGGGHVDADSYRDARRAYEDFAFPRVWA